MLLDPAILTHTYNGCVFFEVPLLLWWLLKDNQKGNRRHLEGPGTKYRKDIPACSLPEFMDFKLSGKTILVVNRQFAYVFAS